MAVSRLSEIRKIRLEKVEKLRALGINPYPSRSRKDYSNKEITSNFKKYAGKKITLTGRLMSWREHGQIVFGHIEDESGKIQLFIKADLLEKTSFKKQTLGFDDLSLLDIGDFIEATGTITKTTRGEMSLEPVEIKILTKSLRPLPEKWEGLKDQELIFRKRYLDLVMNSDHRKMFRRKAKFWEASRQFLKARGFMEVETPVLEHVTGGADARPFVTHHNALDEDFYLRISTELYLKRLIGGGFEELYTLGPNFRNEGMDNEHLQEYYQLEWYWAYADYKDNMKLVQEMFRALAREVYQKTKFTSRGHTFDLANKWKEIDYSEIIKERHDINIFSDPEEKMRLVLKKHKVELPGVVNKHRLIDNLWKLIRKDIAGPAFLINIPKLVSPLAKSKPEDERITERFQIIIAGSELGNGYSELNDPVDQYQRFKSQQAAREAGDEEAQMMDEDFIEMLEYGMPPTSGYGHSERVFWFLEDVTAREGVFFPQMKRK
jgi:lysyl-tRNA synthetase class 2